MRSVEDMVRYLYRREREREAAEVRELAIVRMKLEIAYEEAQRRAAKV